MLLLKDDGSDNQNDLLLQVDHYWSELLKLASGQIIQNLSAALPSRPPNLQHVNHKTWNNKERNCVQLVEDIGQELLTKTIHQVSSTTAPFLWATDYRKHVTISYQVNILFGTKCQWWTTGGGGEGRRALARKTTNNSLYVYTCSCCWCEKNGERETKF